MKEIFLNFNFLVFEVLIKNKNVLIKDLFVTSMESIIGIIISVSISFFVVYFMYISKKFSKIFKPILFLSQTIPTIILVPIIVIFFGYSFACKVFLVVVNCFFPITVSLLGGIEAVDKDFVNLFLTMKASKQEIFRYVMLPLSKPHFFSGLKIAATYAVIGSVIAEWMGGEDGLGIYMIRAKKSYKVEGVIVSTLLVWGLTVLLIVLIKIIEKNKLKILGIVFLGTVCMSLVFFTLFKMDNDSKDVINVVLDYTPNTNHTGIYVAEKLGFFKNENITVNIHQPYQDGAGTMVALGKAEFGIDFQDQLASLFENDELCDRVKVVATILQHNTAVILSKESSKIHSINDLENKSFATSINTIDRGIVENMLHKVCRINFLSLDLTDALSIFKTNVDAMCSYYGWDAIAAQIKGIKTSHIFYRDIDSTLDFYTPVLISNSQYIKDNPEKVKKFLSALSKGYQYAVMNPSNAAEILLEFAPELDKTLVFKSQNWLANEYISDANKWGVIDKQRWDRFYVWLYEHGIIKTKLYEKEVLYDQLF